MPIDTSTADKSLAVPGKATAVVAKPKPSPAVAKPGGVAVPVVAKRVDAPPVVPPFVLQIAKTQPVIAKPLVKAAVAKPVETPQAKPAIPTPPTPKAVAPKAIETAAPAVQTVVRTPVANAPTIPAANPIASAPAPQSTPAPPIVPAPQIATKPTPVFPAANAAVSPPVLPHPALDAVPVPVNLKDNPMAAAFETTQETVKNTVNQMNKKAEDAMTSGKAAMEQITAKSKEAVEQGMKSLDEITETARGNVEALLASARIATTGIESIATHVAEVSRKSFDEASAAMKAMTGAKTPNEFLQLQTDYTKGQFDHAVAEFSKLSEMMVKLAGEVFEPVQNRAAITTEKLKSTFTK